MTYPYHCTARSVVSHDLTRHRNRRFFVTFPLSRDSQHLNGYTAGNLGVVFHAVELSFMVYEAEMTEGGL